VVNVPIETSETDAQTFEVLGALEMGENCHYLGTITISRIRFCRNQFIFTVFSQMIMETPGSRRP
jgi:hypothetical protein